MDLRPIGVFDSGSGGLTAVREIRSILPSENIIYFGDTSRVPYGSRSAEILLRFAKQDVRFLRTFDIKALVVACGTVSTTALPQLQAENGDLPMLGVVEPSCRRAAASTRNKRVGLIATAASVRSGAYERTIAGLDGDITVISKACPLFVPLVENGRFRPGDTVIETVAREYLEPLRDTGIDTLITAGSCCVVKNSIRRYHFFHLQINRISLIHSCLSFLIHPLFLNPFQFCKYIIVQYFDVSSFHTGRPGLDHTRTFKLTQCIHDHGTGNSYTVSHFACNQNPLCSVQLFKNMDDRFQF